MEGSVPDEQNGPKYQHLVVRMCHHYIKYLCTLKQELRQLHLPLPLPLPVHPYCPLLLRRPPREPQEDSRRSWMHRRRLAQPAETASPTVMSQRNKIYCLKVLVIHTKNKNKVEYL